MPARRGLECQAECGLWVMLSGAVARNKSTRYTAYNRHQLRTNEARTLAQELVAQKQGWAFGLLFIDDKRHFSASDGLTWKRPFFHFSLRLFFWDSFIAVNGDNTPSLTQQTVDPVSAVMLCCAGSIYDRVQIQM